MPRVDFKFSLAQPGRQLMTASEHVASYSTATAGGNCCIFSFTLAAERARTSQPEPLIVEANRLKTSKTGVVGRVSRPPVSTSSATPHF